MTASAIPATRKSSMGNHTDHGVRPSRPPVSLFRPPRGPRGEIDGTWCTAYFADVLVELAVRAPGSIDYNALRLYRDSQIAVYLTPFDDVEREARVVLVGLTPGRSQFEIAVKVAGLALRQGRTIDEAITAAKAEGAFAGPMRTNLVRMLDDIRLRRALGVQSCWQLFDPSSRLISSTSAICHATFRRDTENYNGRPGLARHPVLRTFVSEVLAENLAQVPEALVIPLGKHANEAVHVAGVDPRRVVRGFPHPSGQNSGRNMPHTATFVAGLESWRSTVREWFL
jgi:hypothetical protein